LFWTRASWVLLLRRQFTHAEAVGVHGHAVAGARGLLGHQAVAARRTRRAGRACEQGRGGEAGWAARGDGWAARGKLVGRVGGKEKGRASAARWVAPRVKRPEAAPWAKRLAGTDGGFSYFLFSSKLHPKILLAKSLNHKQNNHGPAWCNNHNDYTQGLLTQDIKSTLVRILKRARYSEKKWEKKGNARIWRVLEKENFTSQIRGVTNDVWLRVVESKFPLLTGDCPDDAKTRFAA
jgi:hypothetical protein